MDILPFANVVCSFTSTTLLEALTLDAPIVIPDFMEAKNPDILPFVIGLDDVVDYASDEDELVEMLREKALSGDIQRDVELSRTSMRLLDHWVGNGDGQASARVRKVVDDLVAKPSAKYGQ